MVPIFATSAIYWRLHASVASDLTVGAVRKARRLRRSRRRAGACRPHPSTPEVQVVQSKFISLSPYLDQEEQSNKDQSLTKNTTAAAARETQVDHHLHEDSEETSLNISILGRSAWPHKEGTARAQRGRRGAGSDIPSGAQSASAG